MSPSHSTVLFLHRNLAKLERNLPLRQPGRRQVEKPNLSFALQHQFIVQARLYVAVSLYRPVLQQNLAKFERNQPLWELVRCEWENRVAHLLCSIILPYKWAFMGLFHSTVLLFYAKNWRNLSGISPCASQEDARWENWVAYSLYSFIGEVLRFLGYAMAPSHYTILSLRPSIRQQFRFAAARP